MLQEFINSIADTLLWEIISNKVEQVSELPNILDSGKNIDKNVLHIITKCEVLDSETFDIIGVECLDGKIAITFEMPFVLTGWNDDKQELRITACAKGVCKVPSVEEYDYPLKEFEDMNKQQLLSYANIVDIVWLEYIDVE